MTPQEVQQYKYGTCGAPAVWKLGTENAWHLCDKHAALPIYKRLRKRERIGHEVSRGAAA